ncbi:hypothetical protein SAMD00023353_0300970 [Rosellinia necatrix]|uniref:Uncharacterized protein n=1 Tax=Rosellinia necatrix TaxID=77044 RepID=A0A1S8A5F6_ROSNE|nr:hypothetical protein SAMD00023353_0300970 [Rosellinia necatrix]
MSWHLVPPTRATPLAGRHAASTIAVSRTVNFASRTTSSLPVRDNSKDNSKHVLNAERPLLH